MTPEGDKTNSLKYRRREFLRLAVLSGIALALPPPPRLRPTKYNSRVFLPLVEKTMEEVISPDQNKQLYAGVKAMRALGTEIVGDNTDQWGMYYTKPTNIGLDLISTIVAQNKSFISPTEAETHISGVINVIQQLRKYQGIFPEFLTYSDGKFITEVANNEIHYSSVDSAWLTFALGIVRDNYTGKSISSQADTLIDQNNYSVFLDASGLMGAGFTVDAPSNTKKADYGYSYDNKNSEYRATILPLVALGKLPETSWNNMYYHWVQKEGLPMADGYFMNAFVELTGNIFMNEMQLAPNTFAISHRNYVTATRMIAERLGYQIYGWAPATNPPTGYTEYGLDLNTVVSPYAAALLTTTEESQSVANFKKVVGLSLNGSASLPDVLSSA